jgi:RnfABCDGE-type electron transport complex B subunit
MTALIVILAAATMLVLAVFMAYVLGWANKTFHVEVDPRVEAVLEALPGANCGGCGLVGCGEYAEAVVAGTAPPDQCPVGGAACAEAIAAILGIELTESFPHRPVVHCRATTDERLKRRDYVGERTCVSATLVAGVQGCTYGCLGLGDCEAACDYDAIHIQDGLAVVDYDRCVGCGACQRACPRRIIEMRPFKAEKILVVGCSNRDFGKDVKAVCKVGCTGCKACAKFSELFEMDGNLPVIDYDRYDPDRPEEFVKAYEKCPAKCLVPVGMPTPADVAALAEGRAPPTDSGPDTVDRTRWWG